MDKEDTSVHTTKTWNYAAVTQQAEQRIADLMTQCREKSDYEEVAMLRHWAYGVYILWGDITHRSQSDGDSERLEALTRRW